MYIEIDQEKMSRAVAICNELRAIRKPRDYGAIIVTGDQGFYNYVQVHTKDKIQFAHKVESWTDHIYWMLQLEGVMRKLSKDPTYSLVFRYKPRKEMTLDEKRIVSSSQLPKILQKVFT